MRQSGRYRNKERPQYTERPQQEEDRYWEVDYNVEDEYRREDRYDNRYAPRYDNRQPMNNKGGHDELRTMVATSKPSTDGQKS